MNSNSDYTKGVDAVLNFIDKYSNDFTELDYEDLPINTITALQQALIHEFKEGKEGS